MMSGSSSTIRILGTTHSLCRLPFPMAPPGGAPEWSDRGHPFGAAVARRRAPCRAVTREGMDGRHRPLTPQDPLRLGLSFRMFPTHFFCLCKASRAYRGEYLTGREGTQSPPGYGLAVRRRLGSAFETSRCR